MINVAIAGATGWTGGPLSRAVMESEDLDLVAAVARTTAGQDLGEVLDGERTGVPIFAEVADALASADVLVDFTSHESVQAHVMTAVEYGVNVVIGTSGLTGEDFTEIDSAARLRGVGVVAAGNFSLSAAMVQAAALLAARYIPHWEVIDYASATKADVPSGTSRELAERLASVRRPEMGRSLADTAGPIEARGATVDGVQIHSVRLPSFVVSTEVVFGLEDERLVLRHDAGGTPAPYVMGTLLAIRRVGEYVGVVRGLDQLLT